MAQYKITKQLIRRFQDAVPEVRLLNGATKQASATVVYANGFEYKIVVEKVVNNMEDYTSRKDSVDMWYPISSRSATRIEVPKDLYFVVDKLNDLVQTTGTEEKEYKQEFENYLQKFYSDMGWK
jgi:hypothetical protein